MNRLHAQLPALQGVLSQPHSGGGPANLPSPSDVDAFIRAIRRKARFAEMHLDLLQGIEWDRVERLGRRITGSPIPDSLSVRLSEASLVIEHPGAVTDHVYLAFDGLTAALVNMTDTLARLVNLVYMLGIDPRRASLLAVRDKCALTSPLGLILYDARHTDWLKKVRDLRGRCQHADIEEVLTLPTGSYANRRQPCIDATYSWVNPSQLTLIVSYAQQAAAAAEDCIVATMTAIVGAPANPIT